MKRAIQVLVNHLKEKQFTIAFAESMTCGLITHKLGSIVNTSEILAGSIICYDEKVKTDLLKINKSTIKKHSAESQQVANEMVQSLSKLMEADIYAAITGLAASGGSETKYKPVGTVFFAVLFRGKLFRLKKKFKGSPLQIKKKACEELFKLISSSLLKE